MSQAQPRTYRSSIRDTQAAHTRERIIEAARTFLETHDLDQLTLRRTAELALVSPPTVYAHFPTLDDLMVGFLQWLKPLIGMDEPLPGLDRLPEVPTRLFPLYEAQGVLLRKLIDSPAWDRRRLADRDRRIGDWIAAINAGLPASTTPDCRVGAYAIASQWSPTHWRWLRDTAGLSPDDAVASAVWSVRALVRDLKRPAPHED